MVLNNNILKLVAGAIKFYALLFLLLTNKTYAADKPIWELRVTTAQVNGICLFKQKWLQVGGNYSQWKLIRIDDPKKFSGKIGDTTWQFLRSHTSNFLLPKGESEDGWPNNGKYFFKLDAIDETTLDSYRSISKVSTAGNPYDYVDDLRISLKNPKLLPATVIRYIDESELYALNRLNSFNPFNGNIDGRKIIVPIERSVCDLNIIYLMNNAKARYTRNIIGIRKLISDETIPTDNEKKTFAQRWLDAQ